MAEGSRTSKKLLTKLRVYRVLALGFRVCSLGFRGCRRPNLHLSWCLEWGHKLTVPCDRSTQSVKCTSSILRARECGKEHENRDKVKFLGV